MAWLSPLPQFTLIPTTESESFRTMGEWETGIPLDPHPGAFGVVRKHHTHEGVDLYAPVGTKVHAVEAGRVVKVVPFTGEFAGSPWWHETWAMLIEGESGVVCYGEINPLLGHHKGKEIMAGEPIGRIAQVLKNDKGRPMSMLHLELYEMGTSEPVEWLPGVERPAGLRDPTPFLIGR